MGLINISLASECIIHICLGFSCQKNIAAGMSNVIAEKNILNIGKTVCFPFRVAVDENLSSNAKVICVIFEPIVKKIGAMSFRTLAGVGE